MIRVKHEEDCLSAVFFCVLLLFCGGVNDVCAPEASDLPQSLPTVVNCPCKFAGFYLIPYPRWLTVRVNLQVFTRLPLPTTHIEKDIIISYIQTHRRFTMESAKAFIQRLNDDPVFADEVQERSLSPTDT